MLVAPAVTAPVRTKRWRTPPRAVAGRAGLDLWSHQRHRKNLQLIGPNPYREALKAQESQPSVCAGRVDGHLSRTRWWCNVTAQAGDYHGSMCLRHTTMAAVEHLHRRGDRCGTHLKPGRAGCACSNRNGATIRRSPTIWAFGPGVDPVAAVADIIGTLVSSSPTRPGRPSSTPTSRASRDHARPAHHSLADYGLTRDQVKGPSPDIRRNVPTGGKVRVKIPPVRVFRGRPPAPSPGRG